MRFLILSFANVNLIYKHKLQLDQFLKEQKKKNFDANQSWADFGQFTFFNEKKNILVLKIKNRRKCN